MRLLILSFILVGSMAKANFAMDPQRKNDTAFAKFFLTRVDKWLQSSVFNETRLLSADDKRFVESFLSDPRSLGGIVEGAFLRTYSYAVKVDGEKISYGPFRLVRPHPTDEDIASFKHLLKSHGIARSSTDVVGFGFTGEPRELEVISVLARGTTIELYRNGQLARTTKIERGVTTRLRCPATPAFDQVDRVTQQDGTTSYVYHASGVVDEALSMPGRHLIHKIETGLQLSPGAIDYTDQTHYTLQYP